MIKKGKVVSFHYVLTNPIGEELDRSGEGEPLSYLHGSGQILEGLQAAMEGLKAGAKKEVTLSPKEGYGEHNPALKLTLQRSAFPSDVNLLPRMHFQAELEPGQPPATFTVTSLEKDRVQVDGNHPLAGETLHFQIEVAEIRDATEDEKTHGHAHGPGGHHGH